MLAMLFLLPSGEASTFDRGSSRTIPPGSVTSPYHVATRHDPYAPPTSSAERGPDAMAMVLRVRVGGVVGGRRGYVSMTLFERISNEPSFSGQVLWKTPFNFAWRR